MEKINIENKLSAFSEHWSPKIIGELNGQHVKLVKLQGDFVWHKHDEEDELFYVLRGVLHIAFRDKTVTLHENECIIVPRGVEHKPFAEEEVSIMLFEPGTTLNTGNIINDRTKEVLEKI